MKPEPLMLRSYFSLVRGLYSPEEWAAWAAQSGAKAAGLCDRNNVYGMVRWIQACREVRIKPVVGAVLEQAGGARVAAFCLNRTGFRRLNGLITALAAQEKAAPRKPGTEPFDLLEELVREGWEGLRIAAWSVEALERLLLRTSDDLRAGLLRGRPFAELAAWSRARGVKMIALNEAVWMDAQDREFHRLLRAIDLCVQVEEVPVRELAAEYQRAAGPAEMESFFNAVPEALAENARLAEDADAQSLIAQTGYVFPLFQEQSEERSYEKLEELCRSGVERRYGQSSPAVDSRLQYELSIIRRKRFAGYFLLVHDVVSQFPRTCGRGSGAASIVSYLLGITHVDPLRHNLFFERFLNEGRTDPPDIDVDFPWDEREKALEYVFRTFPGRSALVADHVTFAGKAALREPAKAYGLEESEIERFLLLRRQGRWDEIPEYLRQAAGRLQGFPHYLGSHPGGVVVTPQDILNYTPIQISPMGRPVIAWEKDGAEDAGLVKIDLLGNRSLAVLRDAMAILNPCLETKLDWESFQPYSDPQTIAEIEQGDTLGVFYVESPATRQLLRKMGRGDFEHLVVASSIIRPAANAFINAYVERLHGAAWDPVDPAMEEVLVETLGIMVYQEDVSRVAMAVAGFDAVMADGLRKILTRKDRERRLSSVRERFFIQGRERGRTEAVLEKIWSMILSFDGYSFCKPHSASYALVSMRLAYIKLRYPLVFYTCVINNGGGFYSRSVYLNAIRRLGVAIRGPDANRSGWDYGIEGPVLAPPSNQALRVGLGQLKEIDSAFVEKLLADREARGPFQDLEDFLVRLRPALAALRVLIRSGSLDSLAGEYTRPQMFWVAFFYNRDTLFPGLPRPPAAIGDYRPGTKVQDELSTLGMIFSVFPLDLFRERARKIVRDRKLPPLIHSRQIPKLIDRRVSTAGLFVTRKPVPTKTRREMAFVSFEDQYGLIECVAFPDTWDKIAMTLEQGMAFLATGQIVDDHGAQVMELDGLICLNRV